MNGYRFMSFWGIVIVLIWLALFVYGFSFELTKRDLERHGEIVTWVVTDINVKSPYRAPIVEFTTLKSKKVVFLSQLDVNVRWFKYTIWQEVEVLYHTWTPKTYGSYFYGDSKNFAVINRFREKNLGQLYLWWLWIVVMVAGYFVRKRFAKKAIEFAERMKSLWLQS